MSTPELLLFTAFGGTAAYLYQTLDKLPANLAELQEMEASSQVGLVVASSLGLLLLLQVVMKLFTESDPLGSTWRMLSQFHGQERKLTSSKKVDEGIDVYNKLHEADNAEGRNTAYKTLVNAYYDLSTLFYEWGWGQCFHFAYRFKGESFTSAIKRHEYYLAGRLGVNAGDKVVDVGCGIGGPMRNIARFTKAKVTGVTLNQYQVDRGNELNRSQGLEGQCLSVQGDFMRMPFEDNTYDGAYAIEATCHAPDRVEIYSEIKRVLKPGAVFACYEWCMTDNYDPNNEDHRRWKKQIEEGDGLPDIISTHDCLDALKKAGFEVLDERDLAEDDYGESGRSWMLPLTPSWNPFTQRFQFTWLGAGLVYNMLRVLEFLWLAPKGTCKVEKMLLQGAYGLAGGGHSKTFTPMYLMVGRKPAN